MDCYTQGACDYIIIIIRNMLKDYNYTLIIENLMYQEYEELWN